ncbi:MAG: hypothetical protein JWP44_4484 [Mucilaginibacter sp.]|nr:hypothetical protein [Mucilaginibacter sp.]
MRIKMLTAILMLCTPLLAEPTRNPVFWYEETYYQKSHLNMDTIYVWSFKPYQTYTVTCQVNDREPYVVAKGKWEARVTAQELRLLQTDEYNGKELVPIAEESPNDNHKGKPKGAKWEKLTNFKVNLEAKYGLALSAEYPDGEPFALIKLKLGPPLGNR